MGIAALATIVVHKCDVDNVSGDVTVVVQYSRSLLRVGRLGLLQLSADATSRHSTLPILLKSSTLAGDTVTLTATTTLDTSTSYNILVAFSDEPRNCSVIGSATGKSRFAIRVSQFLNKMQLAPSFLAPRSALQRRRDCKLGVLSPAAVLQNCYTRRDRRLALRSLAGRKTKGGKARRSETAASAVSGVSRARRKSRLQRVDFVCRRDIACRD